MQAQDYAAELPDADFRRSHAFRRERFERLVQYVCWICEDPRALGLERLNRILWYVDRTVFLTRDRVATGATYVRHRGGPWAKPLESVLRDLERRGLVAQRARVGDREPDLLVSLAKPDLAGFDAEEISLVEAMTRALCFDQRSTIAFRDAHDTILRRGAAGRGDPLFHRLLRPARRDQRGRPRLGDPRERAAQGREGAPHRPRRPRAACAPRSTALLWHLLRDPSLGASLPAGGAGSWFVYRQHGVKDAGRAGPRLRLSAGSRRAGAGRDQGGGGRRRGRGRLDGGRLGRLSLPSPSSISRASRAAWVRLVVPSLRKMWRRWTFTVVSQIAQLMGDQLVRPAGGEAAQHLELLGREQLGREARATVRVPPRGGGRASVAGTAIGIAVPPTSTRRMPCTSTARSTAVEK